MAREVFLERGIRATTADVAERANVSEGTIFHRFKSKEALFRAAMQFDPEEVPEPFATLSALSETGPCDLRATLIDVGRRTVEVGRIALPIMMMSWSNPAGDYCFDAMIGKKQLGYRKAYANLRDFFAREIEAGRLRAKAEVLSRVFMGSLHHFCMTELIFADEPQVRALTADDYVEALVDLLLRGASPDRDVSSHPRAAVGASSDRPSSERPKLPNE